MKFCHHIDRERTECHGSRYCAACLKEHEERDHEREPFDHRWDGMTRQDYEEYCELRRKQFGLRYGDEDL